MADATELQDRMCCYPLFYLVRQHTRVIWVTRVCALLYKPLAGKQSLYGYAFPLCAQLSQWNCPLLFNILLQSTNVSLQYIDNAWENNAGVADCRDCKWQLSMHIYMNLYDYSHLNHVFYLICKKNPTNSCKLSNGWQRYTQPDGSLLWIDQLCNYSQHEQKR